MTTPPNRKKNDFKGFYFKVFTKEISAKLNELESESDTLAQNGLESAKFLIPVPHYNFCIHPDPDRLVNCARFGKIEPLVLGVFWGRFLVL